MSAPATDMFGVIPSHATAKAQRAIAAWRTPQRVMESFERWIEAEHMSGGATRHELFRALRTEYNERFPHE